MKYPTWAPRTLVQIHQDRPDKSSSARRFRSRDPDVIIGYMREANPDGFSDGELETLHQRYTRWSSRRGLPDTERTELLGKLLTNQNMKDVWKALAKRAVNESAPWEFFLACETGITGWRGDQKQTPVERRAFYQEISETAEKLISLLMQSSEFDNYSIDNLISDIQTELINNPDVEWAETDRTAVLEQIAARKRDEHGHSAIYPFIPSVNQVLHDVGEKAKQYLGKEPKVKKPNSPNAEIHYFIRTLSEYCRHTYNQPLHDVVATTAAVVFPRMDIDVDYVQKLVNG